MERESRAPKSVSCGHPRLSRPSSPSHKKNLLSFFQKLWFISPHPDSVRGADASSRTRGGMRWTWRVSRDERHSICGRRSRVVPAPRCWCQASRIYERGDGDNKARSHRGDHGISRKTIAQGMPECFGEPVVTNSCAFFYRARGCGCIEHPAFPAPSLIFEGDVSQNSDAIAPRECGVTSSGLFDIKS